MITFLKMGHMGQLGNQLFQFSTLYSLSKRLDEQIVLPIENCYTVAYKNQIWQSYLDLFNCFNLPKSYLVNRDEIKPEFYYKESTGYDESFLEIKKNTSIEGYFQSEKYFCDVKNELLETLSFQHPIKRIANNILNKIETNTLETVGVHIRRRDYVSNGIDCKQSYYFDAIKYFQNIGDFNYVFVSDDVEWCKEIFGAMMENIHFTETEGHYVDLCVLSLCNHNIICNSSFGWWGSWLNQNPNKIVVSPKNWYPETDIFKRENPAVFCSNWVLL